MPTSATGKNRNPLSGPNEPATGKANARAEPLARPGNKSRKARIREDVDPDYAEEAEDFFYGEGM